MKTKTITVTLQGEYGAGRGLLLDLLTHSLAQHGIKVSEVSYGQVEGKFSFAVKGFTKQLVSKTRPR